MRKTVLVLAVSLCSFMAQSQISHHDISPDVVVGQNWEETHPEEMLGYGIKIFSSEPEFYFQNYSSMEVQSYLACFEPGSGVVCNGENVSNIPFGTSIGNTSTFMENQGGSPSFPVLHEPTDYIAWIGQTGYIGIKVKNGANTHYGWIKFSMNATPDFTIYEYAYNTVANQPITAGQTGVGIESHKIIKTEFAIYPNPAKDRIVIDGASAAKRIVIVNAVGERVIDVNSESLKNNSVDVSGLVNGVYFVTLYTQEGILTKKMIKK